MISQFLLMELLLFPTLFVALVGCQSVDYGGVIPAPDGMQLEIREDGKILPRFGVQKRLFAYPYIQQNGVTTGARKLCPHKTSSTTMATVPVGATTEAVEEVQDLGFDDPKSAFYSVLSSKFQAMNGQRRHKLRPLRSSSQPFPRGFYAFALRRGRRSVLDNTPLQRRCL